MPARSPTAVIVDDEQQLRVNLKKHLTDCWPELYIIAEADNGVDALNVIKNQRPDIVFLDIQMPAMTGLEVAAQLATTCHLVFITAYDQYAVQAFDSAAVDYLLKPVTQDRLQNTIARLKTHLTATPVDLSMLVTQLSERLINPAKRYLQWLRAALHDDIVMVPVNEVDFFQAADKYTSAITQHTEWLIRTSLKDLETELDPDRFWRIHRNAIVRVEAIAKVSQNFRGKYTVSLHNNGRKLIVGRSYIHLFKKM